MSVSNREMDFRRVVSPPKRGVCCGRTRLYIAAPNPK
jgi:hypothetical protein